MNLPATVNWKLLNVATSVALALASVGLGISAQANVTPSKSIKSSSLADGTYLYGETPQSNQFRKNYIVFQRQQEKVVGAFYYPSSEFKCFTGSLTNKTLNVKPASFDKSKNGDIKIKLSDMHQIQLISANDQRILSVCKQATVTLAN